MAHHRGQDIVYIESTAGWERSGGLGKKKKGDKK